MMPGLHHDDAIGHRQRLFLVVGDHDRGDVEALACSSVISRRKCPRTLASRAHSGSSSSKRPGDVRQRARQRHALLLATGELRRIFRRLIGQADELEQVARAR